MDSDPLTAKLELIEWLDKIDENIGLKDDLKKLDYDHESLGLLNIFKEYTDDKKLINDSVLSYIDSKLEEQRKLGEYLDDIVRSQKFIELGVVNDSEMLCCINGMADISKILDCDTANDTDLLLKMISLESEIDSIAEECDDLKLKISDVTPFIKISEDKYNEIKKFKDEILAIADEDPASIRQKQEKIQFMELKINEYKTRVAKLNPPATELDAHHNSDYSYESIDNMFKEIHILKEKIEPLKKQLEEYHDLPPNNMLAKFKLNELKNQIVELNKELEKKSSSKKIFSNYLDETDTTTLDDQSHNFTFNVSNICNSQQDLNVSAQSDFSPCINRSNKKNFSREDDSYMD